MFASKFPFPWTADFVLDNERVSLVVTAAGAPLYVSFTGDFDGSGQIVDRLRAATTESEIIEICDAWDALHLKRVDALTEEQADILETVHTSLLIVNGERYGTPGDLEDVGEADFSNGSDVIDSRDVIKRIEELEGAFESAGLDAALIAEDDEHDANDAARELVALRDLESQAEDYAPDWRHGETLIRESYFVEWAEDYLKEIGDLPQNIPGYIAIDWEKTADNIRVDYTEVKFDGVTYLIR